MKSSIKHSLVLFIIISLFLPLCGCKFIDNKKIEKYTAEGNSYYSKYNFELAIEQYTLALELDSTRANTLNNRGMAHLMLDQYDEALLDFNRAIAQVADNHVYYYNAAITLELMNLPEEALELYDKAMEHSPDENTTVSYYYAIIACLEHITQELPEVNEYGTEINYSGNEYFVRLCESYRKVIALGDNTDDNWLALAADYYRQGDLKSTIECYKSALAILEAKEWTEANAKMIKVILFNIGSAYSEEGDQVNAAEYYNLYLNGLTDEQLLEDTAGVAILELADFAQQSGDLDGALGHFMAYLDIHKDTADVYLAIADIFYERGDWSRARDYYLLYLELGYDYAAETYLGSCYYEMGDFNSAIETLNSVIEHNDQYAWAYYIRSKVWEVQGYYIRARDDLNKALELNPVLN